MIDIAQVAVSSATIHFDKLYSYEIPSHLKPAVHIGSMVLVPFGKGNRCRMAIVLGVQQQKESVASKFKSLLDVAPEESILTRELLDIVGFLKERTFCTWYDAVKAVIPYGAQYKAVEQEGRMMLQKQLTAYTETQYILAKPLPEKPKPGHKQLLAQSILQYGAQTAKVLAEMGVSRAVLENLCEKGYLEKQQVPRKITPKFSTSPIDLQLSCEQQQVYDQLKKQLDGEAHAALLHGVTASGKTILFIKLLQETLRQGKQALVLVPEIGLTPQMVQKLSAFFGEKVAVQHSALNHTERLLQWIDIQKGKASIVVGTRSAVFAPLDNIGLIIIDEEHEKTYHSESSPRYKAHDIAKLRAASHGALLLLASATPSIESYYAAQHGKYQLYELTQRYSRQQLPKVDIIDMRQELQQGNTSQLSNALRVQIAENLARGEQSILLLNRRGYQTVAMCTQCAEVIKCTSCSVPMVYHKAQEKLLCHYCGKVLSPVPTLCPCCGGTLRYTGFGTQRIEEELTQTFPQARVLRMDQDSTAKKDAHEILFKQFAAGEYDILLGTQMVAKGLDFPKVSLVGVLGIDQMLFAQGFRACETVFSLITQVVGRAGRSDLPGRAIIQTMDSQNTVLQLAAKQDYKTFYQQEIAFRKFSLYPPFCSICMVLFTGEKEAAVAQAAAGFGRILAKEAEKAPHIPLRVLGPAPLHIAMVKNQYRYKLTIKCREDNSFRQLMEQVLQLYADHGLSAKATVSLDLHSDADL